MPAMTIPVAGPIGRYAIVGQYHPEDHGFVRHVGLLNQNLTSLSAGSEVIVAHMGPPLGMHGKMKADVVATLSLTNDDIRRIDLWICEALEEQRPPLPFRSYTAIPHCDWVVDTTTGIKRYRRFSCSGFVAECFREAIGSQFVPLDDGSLPAVGLTAVESIYGRRNGHERFWASIGLQGEGPFALLLPGYLINALNRNDAAVRSSPHSPSVEDSRFPHRDSHERDP